MDKDECRRMCNKSWSEGFREGFDDGAGNDEKAYDALLEVNQGLLSQLSEERERVKSEYDRGARDGFTRAKITFGGQLSRPCKMESE